MILVTGATGKVGSQALALLRERDVPVRALVRNPAKAEELRATGGDVAIGDFDDPSSLRPALEGIDVVLLISPGGAAEQEMAVLDAAVSAGVRHVVKLTSKATPDSPIARQRWHAQVEERLATSGLAHTLMRCNAFMQNTFMLAPAIKQTGGFASSAGHGRIGMIDTRDVAAVAAHIVSAPAEHAQKTYWLSGPELVSYADVAEILSGVLGRPVTYSERTQEEDEAVMVQAGLPQPIAAMNALAMSSFAQGSAEWLAPDVAELLGRPPRTFASFAAEHADAWA
jgi:uncharacterized protein YbjT (DUF2867 family)